MKKYDIDLTRKIKRDHVISIVHGRDLVGVYYEDDNTSLICETSPIKADQIVRDHNTDVLEALKEEREARRFDTRGNPRG